MVHVMLLSIRNVLYCYISNFHSMCPVPNMAVFCSFLVLCLSGMLLRHFLNDFDVFPLAPIITGDTCFYILHALHFFCMVFIS
jgi:hypothetical protein